MAVAKISASQLDKNPNHFVAGGTDSRQLLLANEAVGPTQLGFKIVTIVIPASSFTLSGGNSEYDLAEVAIVDTHLDSFSDLSRNGVSLPSRVSGTPAASEEWKLTTSVLTVYGNILSSGDTYQLVYAVSTTGDGSGTVGALRQSYLLTRTTTNATAAELTLGGAAPSASNVILLEDDMSVFFTIWIAARRTDVNDESAAYMIRVCLDRNATASTTALVGNDLTEILAEDDTPWSVAVSANTTDGALRVMVTGEASKTIKWVAFVQAIKVLG